MTKLSPHFTLAEAVKSQTAVREEIDNTPPVDVVPRLIYTAENVLEPVRVFYGIPFSPSSWFRCRDLEAEICKKTIERQLAQGRIKSVEEYLDKKQHPTGRAVDFEVPGIPNLELAHYIAERIEFDQLILEFWDSEKPGSGWIHASVRSGGQNRGEILVYDGRSRIYNTGLPPL